MTRVLVCGGREYDDEAHVFNVLDRLHAQKVFSLVIHGACGWDADLDVQTRPMQGADALADRWAYTRDVQVKRVPAAWKRLGKTAGPTRNSGMLAYHPDLVVAFPGNRGTANMIHKARRAGVVVLSVIDRDHRATEQTGEGEEVKRG